MASVSGSQLAFFGNDSTGADVNIVLTPDGSGTLATVAGAYNIEVFTSSVGSPSLAPGFQASVFIEGATQTANDGTPFANNVIQAGSITSVEQILNGSLTVVDQTGFENIQIIGAGAGGPASNTTVVGAWGDTITGSAVAANTQLIDASGTGGHQTVNGGAGNTTVYGGDFDSITGAAGPMTVVGSVGGPHINMTVNGGAGGLAAFDFGTNNLVRGGNGITFIDDTYGSGGNNTLVGGSGGSNFVAGGAGDSIVGGDGPVTILNSFLFDGQTVVGGSGLSTIIEGGSGDSIVAGSGFFAFVSAVSASTIQGGSNASGATVVYSLGDLNSVTGGAGSLQVGAAATNSTIIGGSGDLNVFGLGAGNSVVGGSGTNTINDATGGGATLVGGAGATTIIAGAGDSVVAGTGALEARIRDDISGTSTIDLSAAAVADVVRDVSVAGAGATASVIDFDTTLDRIASATSVDGTNTFLGTSTVVGSDTVLTFLDGSTMTIVGVATPISFIQ